MEIYLVEKNVDVLVIGAGPAGIISAVTARKYYPEKKIVVMKSVAKGVIPCGIPYMFKSLKDPDENKLGNAALKKNDIDVVVETADPAFAVIIVNPDRSRVEVQSFRAQVQVAAGKGVDNGIFSIEIYALR